MSLLTQVIGSAATILALTGIVCLIIFIVMAWKQRSIWKNVPENIEAIVKVENEEQRKSLEKRIARLEKEVNENEQNFKIKEEKGYEEDDPDSEVTSDTDSTDEDGEDFLDDGSAEHEDLFSGNSDEDNGYDELQSGGSSVTESFSDRTGQDEGGNKSTRFTNEFTPI